MNEEVSNLYRFLTLSSPSCNTLTQMKWHQDLGITLTTSEWDRLWRNSITVSNCVRYRVIQLKIMHRAYFTPSKLKKIDENISDLCWHGCGEVGTLIHMLWHCPAVKALWEEVAQFLTKLFNGDISITPTVGLLGAHLDNIRNKKQQKVHVGSPVLVLWCLFGPMRAVFCCYGCCFVSLWIVLLLIVLCFLLPVLLMLLWVLFPPCLVFSFVQNQ